MEESEKLRSYANSIVYDLPYAVLLSASKSSMLYSFFKPVV